MKVQIKANTFEEQVYRSRFDDGVIDLVIGSVFVGLGLSLLSSGYSGFTIVVVAAAAANPLRERLRATRGDYVRLREDRQRMLKRSRSWIALALLLGSLGGIAYFLQTSAWAVEAFAVRGMPLGLMAAAMTILTGLALQLPRAAAYGTLLMIGLVWTGLLRLNPATALIGAGSLVAASGLFFLGRYLRATSNRSDGKASP